MSPHPLGSFIFYFVTHCTSSAGRRKKNFVQFITPMRDDEQNMTNENA